MISIKAVPQWKTSARMLQVRFFVKHPEVPVHQRVQQLHHGIDCGHLGMDDLEETAGKICKKQSSIIGDGKNQPNSRGLYTHYKVG